MSLPRTDSPRSVVVVKDTKGYRWKDNGKVEEEYGRYCLLDCLPSHQTYKGRKGERERVSGVKRGEMGEMGMTACECKWRAHIGVQWCLSGSNKMSITGGKVVGAGA